MAVEQTKKEFTDLKKGDWVRVHEKQNGGQFKHGYKAQWSKWVYRVVSKSKPANPLLQVTYGIDTEEGKVTNRFGRGALLKVPDKALFVKPLEVRPDYSNGQIFDREAHMRNLHTSRSHSIQHSSSRSLRSTKKYKTTGPYYDGSKTSI